MPPSEALPLPPPLGLPPLARRGDAFLGCLAPLPPVLFRLVRPARDPIGVSIACLFLGERRAVARADARGERPCLVTAKGPRTATSSRTARRAAIPSPSGFSFGAALLPVEIPPDSTSASRLPSPSATKPRFSADAPSVREATESDSAIGSYPSPRKLPNESPRRLLPANKTEPPSTDPAYPSLPSSAPSSLEMPAFYSQKAWASRAVPKRLPYTTNSFSPRKGLRSTCISGWSQDGRTVEPLRVRTRIESE